MTSYYENKKDALVQGLMLAITAPTEKQALRAVALAQDMIARFELSTAQVEEAKRVVELLLEKEEEAIK